MLLGPVEFGIACFLFVALVVQIRLWMERAALKRRERMLADARRIFHGGQCSLEQRGHLGVGLVASTRPSLPILIACFAIVWLFSPRARGEPKTDLLPHEMEKVVKLYGEHVVPVNFWVAWYWYLILPVFVLPVLLVWITCYVVKHHFGMPLRRAIMKVRHAFELSIYMDNERRLKKGDTVDPTSSSPAV